MFFVRAVFLIVLVLLLMPSDGEESVELYATAQRTISDIGGFCTRNPDVCENVSSAFGRMVAKLKSATDSIEETLRDTGIGAERTGSLEEHTGYRDNYSAEYDGQYASPAYLRTRTTSSLASDTLTVADKQPAWRGPGRN